MSKRPRGDVAGDLEPPRKKSKGFSVGPANLPDGTYKRKTQKIKSDLIAKAKVKKAYAKIKSLEDENDQPSYNPYTATPVDDPQDNVQSLRADIHPERKAMLDEPEPIEVVESQRRRRQGRKPGLDSSENVNGYIPHRRERVARHPRYQKEFAQAEERKTQLLAKQHAREERDKDRKAMAKARRPGKDGKMKLGRQGTILLNRVRRMAGEGKI